ncbi:MAG TPA: hypothetical protein VIK14_18060 [Ignavibacteria bacterium]
MEYPWYTLLNNSEELLQGDLIPECPIVIPPASVKEDDNPVVEIKLIDSIILSQSCDLEHNNVDIVLVCPFYPLKTFLSGLPPEQNSTKKAISKTIENLKKGFLPGYHLLDKFDGYIDDYQVVDFRNVYGIQYDTLKTICKEIKERLRLLPPYREHLSQSFARYFMRVGLPQDIKIDGY